MTATIADGGGQAVVPYAGKTYSSVLRLTGNPQDAEVLVQETPHRGPVY
jgi:DNA-directed RNA polymerase specialized sigma24 family protein